MPLAEGTSSGAPTAGKRFRDNRGILLESRRMPPFVEAILLTLKHNADLDQADQICKFLIARLNCRSGN